MASPPSGCPSSSEHQTNIAASRSPSLPPSIPQSSCQHERAASDVERLEHFFLSCRRATLAVEPWFGADPGVWKHRVSAG